VDQEVTLNKGKPINLMQYSSADEIVQAQNSQFTDRVKEVDGIDISDDSIEWGDEEFSLNNDQIIDHIHESGFWAFADTWTNTVHVWFDPRTDEFQRFRVLAHEVAHLSGNQCKDPIKEERRCDAFMEIASVLFILWKQVQ
jgi:hypothetical protein